ncbi:MAG: type II toxin-antitoxin system HicA family toxin [Nanoarchaeota archaeon]|nr:type II toxin-antitoxin system HicA family toxin [Nanoarchaeota archaeon]MBU4124006.1 type II toxin-antitoxin system HicA family toxin [Nanoarchaeota archaeon]
MTPSLPVRNGREIIKLLVKHFNCETTMGRGDHVRVHRRINSVLYASVVQNTNRDIDRSLLVKILKQLNIDRDEFIRVC